jgi:cytochrome c oxidase assembly protein subunit 15
MAEVAEHDEQGKVVKNDKAIGIWLLFVAFLVFLMIVVGGATRLTESGLSIVHWKPISGTIPPMSVSEWQVEFNAYKQFPEYQQINKGMSLSEFKAIFWWEYAHRLLGRLIGLAFALPLLFFMARRMVRDNLKIPLFGLLALGAGQGVMGWYMVTSGLVDEPEVSHLRLAAHLSLALVIFMGLLWQGLLLIKPKHHIEKKDMTVLQYQVTTLLLNKGIEKLRPYIYVFIALAFLQSVFGALVAGLDAGYAFNTWPLMEGAIIPALAYPSPILHSIIYDPMSVQLSHRMIAYVLFLLGSYIFWMVAKTNSGFTKSLRLKIFTLFALLVTQVGLGIATLLSGVHIPIAVLHQGGGVLLLGTGILVLACMYKKS